MRSPAVTWICCDGQNIAFLLDIAVTVGIAYGLIRLTLPSLSGDHLEANDCGTRAADKQKEEKDPRRGDAERVADLEREAVIGAIPRDAAGVHLAESDREWCDDSALIAGWR